MLKKFLEYFSPTRWVDKHFDNAVSLAAAKLTELINNGYLVVEDKDITFIQDNNLKYVSEVVDIVLLKNYKISYTLCKFLNEEDEILFRLYAS